MAKSESIFKRYELKYLLTHNQYEKLCKRLEDRIVPDEYFKSTILSLYYDTPQKTLIRRSIEKPAYKEKLRLRSYGPAEGNDKVYVELKKKYDGIVYKRRTGMKYSEAKTYLDRRMGVPKNNQIVREIDYFMDYYGDICPSMLLSYDRKAYKGIEDEHLRITFDENILYRENELSLNSGIFGEHILGEGEVLMELKISGSIPLWLVLILNELKIYKTSFSKYGRAYCMSSDKKNKDERIKYSQAILVG